VGSGDNDEFYTYLRSCGYEITISSESISKSLLSDVSILFISCPNPSISNSEIDAIRSFVSNGGGLLMQGLGWSWVGYQKTPLEENPVNKIGMLYGMKWIDGYIGDQTNNNNGCPIFHTFPLGSKETQPKTNDVTISDLDTTSESIKYKIQATRNGRTFSNARVYIDNELVGRTDSEGFYVSYIPFPIGSHTITVVYNPLPLTGGGDADISTPVGLSQATSDQLEVGDIGMGSLVPMEDRFFGGAGRVEVTDKPQKFAVNLRIIIQAKQINTENVAAGNFDVVSNFLPGSSFNPFNLPTSAGQNTDSRAY